MKRVKNYQEYLGEDFQFLVWHEKVTAVISLRKEKKPGEMKLKALLRSIQKIEVTGQVLPVEEMDEAETENHNLPEQKAESRKLHRNSFWV